MLARSISNKDSFMDVTDKAFYQALGQRVAQARKAREQTQQQLADQLGIAQQTLAHYESGRLRIAAALLPPLAAALGLSVEELIGETEIQPALRRGPVSRVQQQLERIQQLPRAKQRFVMEMLETVLQQAGQDPAATASG